MHEAQFEQPMVSGAGVAIAKYFGGGEFEPQLIPNYNPDENKEKL